MVFLAAIDRYLKKKKKKNEDLLWIIMYCFKSIRSYVGRKKKFNVTFYSLLKEKYCLLVTNISKISARRDFTWISWWINSFLTTTNYCIKSFGIGHDRSKEPIFFLLRMSLEFPPTSLLNRIKMITGTWHPSGEN